MPTGLIFSPNLFRKYWEKTRGSFVPYLVSSISFQVFEAIISWVRQDVTNRYDYTHQLLEHVRLMLLPSEYLITRVQEESLVKNDSHCKDYLLEALSYHLMPKEKQLLIKNVRTRPRTPIGLPKVSRHLICVSSCMC